MFSVTSVTQPVGSRIAKGSGTKVSDVRDLLKQYRQAKKLTKMMKGKGKNMEKMMSKMQKGQLQMKF